MNRIDIHEKEQEGYFDETHPCEYNRLVRASWMIAQGFEICFYAMRSDAPSLPFALLYVIRYPSPEGSSFGRATNSGYFFIFIFCNVSFKDGRSVKLGVLRAATSRRIREGQCRWRLMDRALNPLSKRPGSSISILPSWRQIKHQPSTHLPPC